MESLSPDRSNEADRPGGNGDGRAPDVARGSTKRVARPMKPGDSPGWFGYIAVGIALASLLVGLVVAGWVLFWLARRLMWTG